MRKRISLKTRRPDLDRAAFRAHYEHRHVPLGLGYVEVFRWRRYIRNYVVDCEGAPIGYDCHTEFWLDDEADDEALARFVASPDFRRLDEDDHRFLDVTRRCALDLRETPILARSPAASTASKVALAWRAGSESDSACEGACAAIVDRLGDRACGATLDRAIGEVPETAPFDRLLSIWLADDEPVTVDGTVAPAERWSLLRLDPVETPTSQLWSPGRAL